MANLTRIAAPSFDSSNPALHKLTGLLAGEVIAAGDLIYINADGKAYKADGAAATAPAKAVGMAALAASLGAALTILGPGWRWQYATALTPGARYFVGTTGLLGDAATTGGTTAVAYAVSATDLVFSAIQN